MCFEKRLDKSRADLKIKFGHEAPLNYSESNYSKISKSQNIDFDDELSVEENAIKITHFLFFLYAYQENKQNYESKTT